MRNFLLAAMATVILYGASAGGTVAQSSNDGENRVVKVDNKSQFFAVRIYIIPSERECCWSRDLLEEEVIRLGDYQYLKFDDGSGKCRFDVRIATEYPGFAWHFANFNACRESVLTLRGKDALFSPSNDTEDRRVKIKNESQLAARNVYAIPSNSGQAEKCCWSYDLLRIAEIPRGREHTVNFDDGERTCRFHIRITSEKKGKDWYLEDVNVCTVDTITLRTKSQDGKRRLLDIANKSSVQAVSALIFPEGKSCCWSSNLLGEEGIGKGKSVRVDVDDETGQCRYAYRIARADRRKEWEGTIDICSDPSTNKLPLITLPDQG
jgi:hypothetical protein